VMEQASERPDTEPTNRTEQLRCAICEESIVPGQSRTPNENNEIVHQDCLQASA